MTEIKNDPRYSTFLYLSAEFRNWISYQILGLAMNVGPRFKVKLRLAPSTLFPFHQLTAWVLMERILHLVTKLPAFYEAQNFIATFKTSRHLSTPTHPTLLRPMNIIIPSATSQLHAPVILILEKQPQIRTEREGGQVSELVRTLRASITPSSFGPAGSSRHSSDSAVKHESTVARQAVDLPADSRVATITVHYRARSPAGSWVTVGHVLLIHTFIQSEFSSGCIRAITGHCSFSRVLKRWNHSEICCESWIWVILSWK